MKMQVRTSMLIVSFFFFWESWEASLCREGGGEQSRRTRIRWIQGIWCPILWYNVSEKGEQFLGWQRAVPGLLTCTYSKQVGVCGVVEIADFRAALSGSHEGKD